MQTIDFYFASLAHFFAFSGTILVVLWHIRQVSNGLPKNGFLFLSLAMFTLSLSAIHYFLSSHENDTVKVLIERILSSVGNMFLALSLPYFVFGYGTLSKRLEHLNSFIFFVFVCIIFVVVRLENRHPCHWSVNCGVVRNIYIGSSVAYFWLLLGRNI